MPELAQYGSGLPMPSSGLWERAQPGMAEANVRREGVGSPERYLFSGLSGSQQGVENQTS